MSLVGKAKKLVEEVEVGHQDIANISFSHVLTFKP